jgi:hypothetical protein
MKTSFQYFTEDSSVTLLEENVWKGNLSDRWSIGSTPNGGYSMALATRAISGSLTHKDPLSITANYLERVDFGEAIIKVEPLSITKSLSTARASLIQDNKLKIVFTASFTDFSRSNGLDLSTRSEPDFEHYDDCILHPYKEGFNPVLEKSLEKKYCSDSIWWENNNNKNKACLNLYMSWPERDIADLYSLILFLDATTPPIFNKLGSVGWVPTISLTSHIRGFPKPGPLKVIAKTEFVTKGFMEEDREIWDSEGNLVGQSKQMAKLRIKK